MKEKCFEGRNNGTGTSASWADVRMSLRRRNPAEATVRPVVLEANGGRTRLGVLGRPVAITILSRGSDGDSPFEGERSMPCGFIIALTLTAAAPVDGSVSRVHQEIRQRLDDGSLGGLSEVEAVEVNNTLTWLTPPPTTAELVLIDIDVGRVIGEEVELRLAPLYLDQAVVEKILRHRAAIR